MLRTDIVYRLIDGRKLRNAKHQLESVKAMVDLALRHEASEHRRAVRRMPVPHTHTHRKRREKRFCETSSYFLSWVCFESFCCCDARTVALNRRKSSERLLCGPAHPAVGGGGVHPGESLQSVASAPSLGLSQARAVIVVVFAVSCFGGLPRR